MQEFTFETRGLGTTISVSLIGTDVALATAVFHHVKQRLLETEERFSRFLPHSELSQLNKLGYGQLSTEFGEVLVKAIELSRQTQGAYNPLIQVSRLGYLNTYDKLSGQQPIVGTPYNTNLADIEGPDEMGNIRLAAGQQLDFGGFLKGYLADELLSELAVTAPWCKGAIINIGGDIATLGTDEVHHPFIFTIYNPVAETELPIKLKDACLATSGTYGRKWSTEKGTKHHLVDPTTLENITTPYVSVSVIHEDGALAEAYTKMFFVYGVDRVIEMLGADLPQYLVIDEKGNAQSNLLNL
jgi:FAD:protein FMN transferase